MQLTSPSANNLRWEPRINSPQAERQALAIAQQQGLPDLLARIVAGRGVTIETAADFLNPTLKALMPDPSHLHDMDKAVARLVRAIQAGEVIAVFGDYDVDGATSTALLVRYFRALGINILTYIPDRQAEGYGPNIPAFEALKQQGASVILTVDCGTVAYDPIQWAADAGVDVVVVDHHIANPHLPAAHAVVNPNRIDQDSDCGNLAAVGVVFLLLVALNRALRAEGRQPLPDLMSFLDMVALGTVCDVVPLTGLNRALVKQGLTVMRSRANAGLAALSDVSRMDEAPNTYHAGFLLGPRINAGGRVGKASLGSELLACDDPLRCAEIAAVLDVHNAERKAIEQDVQEQAMAQAESQANQPCILVAAEGWHEGVIGIVAGRLKEQFDRPAMVIAVKDGVGKGSARSVPGADIGAAVASAKMEGLLSAGGGHSMAAGFSLSMEQFDAFAAFMQERLAKSVSDYADNRRWKYDGVLAVDGLTVSLLNKLDQAGPFGMGNPGPRCVLAGVKVISCDRMKDKHLRLWVSDSASKRRIAAVTFNSVNTPLGDLLESSAGKQIHLAGAPKRNRYNGNETVQFMVEDAARV